MSQFTQNTPYVMYDQQLRNNDKDIKYIINNTNTNIQPEITLKNPDLISEQFTIRQPVLNTALPVDRIISTNTIYTIPNNSEIIDKLPSYNNTIHAERNYIYSKIDSIPNPNPNYNLESDNISTINNHDTSTRTPFELKGYTDCEICNGTGWKVGKHSHPCNKCIKKTLPLLDHDYINENENKSKHHKNVECTRCNDTGIKIGHINKKCKCKYTNNY